MLKNYLVRLIIALCITVAISYGAYRIIFTANKNYFNAIQKNDFIFREDTTQYDVLMLGASRMKNTLNPMIFDSITGLNSYNAAASAARILEQKMIFDAYLIQHKAPKYLLMTLDLVTLQYDKYTAYYPNYLAYDNLPPIKEFLDEEGVHTTLYRYLPFLRIVELNDYYKATLLKTLTHEKELRDGDSLYKGYVGNTTDTITVDKLGHEARGEYNDATVQLLQGIIDTAKKHNIQIIFTYAPEYKDLNVKSVDNADEMFALYEKIAAKNGVPFHRHDSLPMCNEKRYFANNGHVNRIGADEYTRIYSQLFKEGKLFSKQ